MTEQHKDYFKFGVLDPEGKHNGPTIGYSICNHCGGHLGYYGGAGSEVDSPENTQRLTQIETHHRAMHALEEIAQDLQVIRSRLK
jgi:hypothetical protein